MNNLKIVLVVAACTALTGTILMHQVFASSSQDFNNDVKTGLIQQQSNPTILQERKTIETGENTTAGDTSEKNIPEVNVEKQIEKEIESESAAKTSSTDNSAASSTDTKDSSGSTPTSTPTPTPSISSVTVSPSPIATGTN